MKRGISQHKIEVLWPEGGEEAEKAKIIVCLQNRVTLFPLKYVPIFYTIKRKKKNNKQRQGACCDLFMFFSNKGKLLGSLFHL